MSVRSITPIITACAVLAISAGGAHATYPERAIKVICTYVAGGGGDLMVRYYAHALGVAAGQPVIVENKAGANGHLGNKAAMDAKPDGYTLLITGASAWVGNPLLMKDVDYDPLTALQPVTTLDELGLGLVVNPMLDIKSVTDLTSFIRGKAGKAKYAIQTSSALVAGNLYLQRIGAQAVGVNYKNSTDAVADVAAGLLDYMFPDITLGLAQAKAGKVRLLAATPARKVTSAPELPTMQDAGVPDFDYSVIWAAWFPAGTAEPIVQRMHDWLVEIVARPQTKTFLLSIGADQRASASPEEMAQVIKAEYLKWKGIVQAAKIEKQ